MSSISSPPKKTKKHKAEDSKSSDATVADKPKPKKTPPQIQARSIDWTSESDINRSLSMLFPDDDIDAMSVEDKLELLMSKFTPKQLGFAFGGFGKDIGVDMKTIDMDYHFQSFVRASAKYIECLTNYWNANGKVDEEAISG